MTVLQTKPDAASLAKPKVVFFNRSYWPDSEATGQLLTELAESLTDDFQVEVVAGQPNHVASSHDTSSLNSNVHNDVRIYRVRHTRFWKHSFIGRMANLLSFTAGAFLRGLWLKKPTVLVMETDPFFLPLLGPWLSWNHKCKLVCYLQDIYPDIAIAVGKTRESFLTRTLRCWLFRAYRRAEAVIVLSDDMAQKCIHYGLPAEKVHVIENWANCERITPEKSENSFRKEHGLADKFVVMYSGNMGLAHQLEPIIEAAARLADSPDVAFVFVGEGAQKKKLESLARSRNLNAVQFLGYQPRESLSSSLSAANVQIVSMRPEAAGCVMPSKLYGILAAGTAVLAICPHNSDLANIVEEHRVGAVCTATENVALGEEIANSIRELLSNPTKAEDQGRRARQLCLRSYDFNRQSSRIRDLISGLLPPAPAPVHNPDFA